jgi:cell division septal protein FtsQ
MEGSESKLLVVGLGCHRNDREKTTVFPPAKTFRRRYRMSFWRLMLYALCVFVGLVIVFFVLPKVFGAKPKEQQRKERKR